MKRRWLLYKLLFIAVFLLFHTIAFAADYSTPGTGVNWTMDNVVASSGGTVTGTFPNYQVNGSFHIRSTDTLTIAPGSIITLNDTTGTYEFYAWGTLKAIGTLTQPIKFTSLNKKAGDWKRIGIDGNGAAQSVLEYVVIEYAKNGVSNWDNSGVQIKNSTMHDCQERGISISNASPLIDGNTIENIDDGVADSFFGVGIDIWNNAHPTIQGNNIRNNSGQGIYVDASHPVITGNIIDNNDTDTSENGIGVFIANSSTAIIQNNTIKNNQFPIYFSTGASGTIDNNQILDNYWGASFHDSANITIQNNVFDNIVTGLYVENVTGTISGNELKFQQYGISVPGTSTVIIKNNNIHDNSIYGIAIQGTANPDIGDVGNASTGDDGGNTFLNNAVHIFNETTNTIKAENNNWATNNLSLLEQRLSGLIDFIPSNPPMASAPVFSSLVINDDATAPSNGNNNGIANASETVELFVRLSNPNSLAVNGGIKGTLSTTSPYITILQNVQTFGDLAASGTVTNTSPYVISIGNSIPDNTVVPFTLTMASTWTTTFTITVRNTGDLIAPSLSNPFATPYITVGKSVALIVMAVDGDPNLTVTAEITDKDRNPVATVTLYDDSTHKDYLAGDKYYGNTWTVPSKNFYFVKYKATDSSGNWSELADAVSFSTHEGSTYLEITNVSNENGLVRVDYYIHPQSGTISTAGWQYSLDGTNWLDIDAAQISNNAAKSAGYSHIGWDSLNGTNNLSSRIGLPATTIYFRMKPVISALSKIGEYSIAGTGPGSDLRGLAFDGATLWSCGSVTDKIYGHRIDANFSIYKTVTYPGGGPSCMGLAWDGNTLWSVDNWVAKIYKHNMNSTLSVAATYNAPRTSPSDIAWDGTNIWTSNWDDSYIYKHNMDGSLSVAASYQVKTPSKDTTPTTPYQEIVALSFVNGNLWVADNWYSNNLYELKNDKVSISTQHNIYGWLDGITWDGRTIWLTDSNAAPNKIMRYTIPSESYEQTSLLFGFDSSDTDEDLMPDWWEIRNGLDPNRYNPAEDSDNDSITNLEEFLNLTNPLANNSTLTDTKPHLFVPDEYEARKNIPGYQLHLSDGFETATLSSLPWVQSGTTNWSVSGSIPHSGNYCAEATFTSTTQLPMTLSVDVNIPTNAKLIFNYRRNFFYDVFFRFFLDDAVAYDMASNTAWQKVEVFIPVGVHSLKWVVAQKGEMGLGGVNSTAAIDDITISLLNADADADGFIDIIEYFNGTDPNKPNSQYADSDGDGMPNIWEIANGLDPNRNDANEDPDNDGLTNLIEYRNGLSPKVSDLTTDRDKDSMPDVWEIKYGLNIFSNDASADKDGDGLTNLQEHQQGTDPTNPDRTPPVLMVVFPVQSPTKNTSPSYTFSSTESGAITYGGNCRSITTAAVVGSNTIILTAVDGGPLSEGAYSNCTITVTDVAGNASAVHTINAFVIDKTGPTLTQVTPVPTPTNNQNPSYTFSSTEAGTITYAGSCSSATTMAEAGNNTGTLTAIGGGVLPEGQYSNCTITVTDAAGNPSAALTINSFTIDTTAPTVTIVSPLSGVTYNSPLTISGTAAGTGTDVISVTWQNVSTGESGPCTGTASWNCDGVALVSGANNVTITATDAANNTGTDTLVVTYVPSYTITVTGAGDNGGTMTSGTIISANWDGLATSGDNTEVVNFGTGPYTITANAIEGRTVAWSGDCASTSGDGTGVALCEISGSSEASSLAGQIVYYPFTGNARDESGNGYDGTVNGATLTTDMADNVDSAYMFDGIDDSIRSDITVPSEYTVSAWAKPLSFNHGVLFEVGDSRSANTLTGFTLTNSNTISLDWQFSASSVGLSCSYSLNTWHFFALTKSGNAFTIFVDGAPCGAISRSISNASGFLIGAHRAATGPLAYFYNGSIDDIHIFDRTLSNAEIQQLYNDGPVMSVDLTKDVIATFSINQYSVTAIAAINGSLDTTYNTSPQTVSHGSTTSYRFNASAGYHVASVSGCGGTAYDNALNDVVTFIYTTGPVTGACTVDATFATNSYTVTASATGNGAGTVASNTGGISYTYQTLSSGTTTPINYGTNVVLTANAGIGSTVAWTTCTGVAGGNGTSSATCTYASLDGTKTATVTFIDNTPPTLTLVTPVTTSTNNQNPSYTFSSTEAGTITYGGSCRSTTTMAIVGENPIILTAVGGEPLPEGVYSNCTIVVTDAAGNPSVALTINTFSIDKTAPTLSIGSPSATLTKGGPVTYTVPYAGADTVTLADANVTLNRTGTAGGTVTVSGTGNTSRTVTISGITGDGTLGISIALGTASDAAGNTAAGAGPSAIFSVDNTPPTLTPVIPVQTPTKNQTPSYTFSSSEAGTITYDGSCKSASTTAVFGGNPIILTAIDGGPFSDGIYSNCTLVVTDAAGNPSLPLAINTFTIDKTAPSDASLSASAGNAQVVLSWTGSTDSGSGLKLSDTYKLVRNERTAPENLNIPSVQCTSGIQIYIGTALSIADADVTNGITYDYRLCAYDAVGNVSDGTTTHAKPYEPGHMSRNSYHLLPEDWLVLAYTGGTGSYSVNLVVLNASDRQLVPFADIQGLSANPLIVEGNALDPDLTLVMDEAERTAYIIHDSSGQLALTNVPNIRKVQTGTPVLQTSTTLVSFGTVTSGTTKDSTVTVTNTGAADLHVTSVTAPAAPFSKISDTCTGAAVVPSGTCSIGIRFAPTAATTYNSSFSISSDGGNATITLQGTGSTGGGGPR